MKLTIMQPEMQVDGYETIGKKSESAAWCLSHLPKHSKLGYVTPVRREKMQVWAPRVWEVPRIKASYFLDQEAN